MPSEALVKKALHTVSHYIFNGFALGIGIHIAQL
jgi:hypothetical protein